MLLERKVSIDSYENFKLGSSQAQQLAVRDTGPTLICNGSHSKCFKAKRKPSIDTFIEQNLQAASVTASVAARSKKAITCDRDTEGNPTRN
jgi:hypothetical protein